VSKSREDRRRRAGRPPAPPDERRGNRVTVWLTDGEKAVLDALAETEGLTVGGGAYQALTAGLRVLARRGRRARVD